MHYIQLGIPVFLCTGLAFVLLNLVWLLVDVLAKTAFELYLTRALLRGEKVRVREVGVNTFSFFAFTDGSTAMLVKVGVCCLLFLSASLCLEFGWDAGSYFVYGPKSTTALAATQTGALGARLLEATGYYLANTHSCLSPPMQGKLKIYRRDADTLALTRKYTGTFNAYFPVTDHSTGQPYCSNRGVRVRGAAVMFVGISADRRRGLTVQRDERHYSGLDGLDVAIPRTIAARLGQTPLLPRTVLEDAAGVVRNITRARGIACRTPPGGRRLCLARFERAFVFDATRFTHVLAQEAERGGGAWFAHALIREPDEVRTFVDHGWWQAYAPAAAAYAAHEMPMALFFADGPGLELGPSFGVLHALAHVLAAGPAYRFSARALPGVEAVRTPVRLRAVTGATISTAGLFAAAMHALLLLVAGVVWLVEFARRTIATRRPGADTLKFRAVRLSREWLEKRFVESAQGLASTDGSYLYLAVEPAEPLSNDNVKQRVVFRRERRGAVDGVV